MKKLLLGILFIIIVVILLALVYVRHQRPVINEPLSFKESITVTTSSTSPTIATTSKHPTITTTSTSTFVTINKFSFILPPNWKGESYVTTWGDIHFLFQYDKDKAGLTIDCPPQGKGAEETVSLFTKNRKLINDGESFNILMDKRTAPQNEPWYWIFVHKSGSTGNAECLVSGIDTVEIEQALESIYSSWK